MLKYVTIKRFSELSGYTDAAIRCKIDEGVWLENKQYRRAPDGRVLISIEGVESWVEGDQGLESRRSPRR